MNDYRKASTFWIITVISLTAALIWIAILASQKRQSEDIQASVSGLPVLEGDFKRADPVGKTFQFPLDHGAHEEYQTEWWYYTGNLQSADGMMYGYQLTFFRRGILPPDEWVDRTSSWAANQIYLAHFTVTEVAEGKFHYWERLSRGAAGLAGAQGVPAFEVWLYDWQVRQIDDNRYHLVASQEDIGLDLILVDEKGPVLQGIDGYSQKGQEQGNASYYYSQTRLHSTGTLTRPGEEINLQGYSWMDHEFSTSALSDGQVGWDWFSLQLDNDREIMVYTIRRDDGSIDSFSSGTLIYEDGSTQRLLSEDFGITVVDNWVSSASGATYPSGWELDIPKANIRLTISPKSQNQELIVSFVYWEGAVTVSGQWGNDTVTGSGYVELTGYAASMQGQF